MAGKPHAPIYDLCIAEAEARLGRPVDRRRILCIGDSAEHDVAGGRNAGFATLLVMQGVSAGHDPASLSPQPDYVMESFRW